MMDGEDTEAATSSHPAMPHASSSLSSAPCTEPSATGARPVQGGAYAAPHAGAWRPQPSTSQHSADSRLSSSRSGTTEQNNDQSNRGWATAHSQPPNREPYTQGRGAMQYQQNSSYQHKSGGRSSSYSWSSSYSYGSGSGGRSSSYAYSYSEPRGGRASSSSYQYASSYQYGSSGQRGHGGRSNGQGSGSGYEGRGNGGRGSGGPPAAAQPPMWRKEGAALLPLPNSTLAAAYAEARGARLAAGERAPAVVIMRGLPGAGKSSRATELAAEAAAQGSSCAVHSTDSYFLNSSGRYVFDATLLSANHERNRAAFAASLAAGVQLVVVDNTNLQRWQYEPYVKAAWVAGYEVCEEVVGDFNQTAAATYAARCVHGVPHEKILVMMEQLQL